jgi:hypothetical protein
MHYQHLISEIANRAQGVFLWVFLVVQSLREGLANGDSISMLEIRLRSLPTDLELFFKHMILSVDMVYQKQMALTFQAALRVKEEPLLLIVYSFLEEEDPDFAIRLPVGNFDEDAVRTRNAAMRRRLNGRYKGLLEVSSDFHQINGCYGGRVDFLHRTVRDFLMTKDIQNLLNGLLDQRRNSCFSLARALLAHLKTMLSYGQAFSPPINQLIQFSRQGEAETGGTDFEALDEFDYCVRMKWGEMSIYGTNTSFLEFATRKGLVLYVKHRIEASPNVLREFPLLMTALDVDRNDEHIDLTGMVEMLLKHGANPNQKDVKTIWNRFVEFHSDNSEKSEHEYWRRLLKILLINGMDIYSESSWADLLFPVVDQHEYWTKTYLSELLETLDILFAHGVDPNQSHQNSTVWQRFLVGALNLDSPSRDESLFLLEAMKSFLLYGADTQSRIRCKSKDSLSQDIEGKRASKAIKKILHRHRLTSEANKSVNELLKLLQSEIRNAEAHDAFCETTRSLTQNESYNIPEPQNSAPIHKYPTFITRDDHVRPRYDELNWMETLAGGPRDIVQMRQDLGFGRSQVPGSRRTRVLGNPEVSKHSKVPSQSTNARAMIRVGHEFVVRSYTREFSEYHADMYVGNT